MTTGFFVTFGILVNEKQVFLFSQMIAPSFLCHKILTNTHDDATGGHLGINKTYEQLHSKYYWFVVFKDVKQWCKSCLGPLLPIPVGGSLDRVAVDFLSPFLVKHSRSLYIVVFPNYYTPWPEAFVLASCEAHCIASLLINEIMTRHSLPCTLLPDRSCSFLSAFVKDTCKMMNTSKLNATDEWTA